MVSGWPSRRAIVHTHGGEISVETHEHDGTQFSIALPVGRAADPQDREDPPPAVGLRIMLVEDEPSVRAATFEALTRAGHEVVAYDDAFDALEAFLPEQFDLVITDLGLPRLSGWDLIERIHERDPDVPSLVMTGYGERPDVVRQAQLGVRVVLPKPFVSRDLTDAVRRAMHNNGDRL